MSLFTMSRVFVINVVILTACLWTLTEANCSIDKSLNETERTRQQQLLQTLDPIIGKRSKQLVTQNGYSYDFILCGNIDPNHNGVSIIQTDSKNQVKVLGHNNQTLVSSEGAWLSMTLQGGDAYEESCNNTTRKAHILFVCDPFQKEVQIRTAGELSDESCYLQFIVSHNIVCPAAPDEGLSGGAIFFILLLVTVGAYFTFGFFYLRLVKGAKGTEQIPNIEFWFKIGNLLADGCGSICRCDQYCGSGVASSNSTTYNGYSPIEERMARDLQDTDRDSALLSP